MGPRMDALGPRFRGNDEALRRRVHVPRKSTNALYLANPDR